MGIEIRLAQMNDREGIHNAHMRSIREVCVKDHGDEVKGWGYRDLGERWIDGIRQQLVWVAARGDEIKGVAYISISEENKSANIHSLYLTPEVLGLGLGKKMMELMLLAAEKAKVSLVTLDSTITAHEFYKKFDFADSGPMKQNMLGGKPVTSFPMQRVFK